MSRLVMIKGRAVDLDNFEARIRELGQRWIDTGQDKEMGQKMVDKAPEIVAWYVEHQCLMSVNSLKRILEVI